MNRREFLKLLTTTTAAMAAASCSINNKNDNVLPYLVPPEEAIIPGMPIFYNSTCTECPANCGMTVKAYDKVINNRHTLCPIKLEGIKGHPINDGGLCIRGQASITRLYHPERIKNPLLRDHNGQFRKATWEEVYNKIQSVFKEIHGKRNIYLSGRTTGTLSELIDIYCQKLGLERLPEFEPISYSVIRSANELLFQKKEIPYYDIAKSDFLLTIGADVVGTFVSPVSYGKQYSQAMKKSGFQWVHLEPHITLTGLNADKRIVIKPASEPFLLVYLLKKINGGIGKQLDSGLRRNDERGGPTQKLEDAILSGLPNLSPTEVTDKTGIQPELLDQIVNQLEKASNPLLIVGEISTASSNGLVTAILAGLIQWSTGMIGNTIDFNRSENYAKVGNIQDIQNCSTKLKNNDIGIIFISRTDPVFYVSEFEQNLRNAVLRVGMSELMNDTLNQCDVILPLSHSLESWGDAVPRKNVISVIQPTLKPLYDTKSEGDILLELIDRAGQPLSQNYQTYLYSKWTKEHGDNFTDTFLKTGYSLVSGKKNASFPTQFVGEESLKCNTPAAISFLKSTKPKEPLNTTALAVVPSLRTYDGRGKSLPILTEIPDPLTTVTYGDWVSMSPEKAKSLDLKDGDEITITNNHVSFKFPIKTQPELAPELLMIQWGQFNLRNLGFDDNSGEIICYIENITIQKTGQHTHLPVMAGSSSQKGRGLLPQPMDKAKYQEYNEKAGLYDLPHYAEYRWGMAINLDACTGCSACVAACYIENNIPIAGLKEHLKGREMSWIRIEPKYEKDDHEFIPMLCQHCDYAPCEYVCPVYATYTNPDGLNAQIYNRCVGTRYCSNNCPYKVRRFNWFDHTWETPLDRMLNPEMFVRGRGVMEKCTFCIQRIRKAKDTAEDEKRKVKEGDIVPACAQTCPVDAITFGNLKDKDSAVYKLSHTDKAYRIFDYLGVEPAIHYIRNKKVDM